MAGFFQRNAVLKSVLPNQAEMDKLDKEGKRILMLVQGHDVNAEPFYAYVAMKPSQVIPFKKAEEQGNYRLRDYGEILNWGKGLEPPEAVVRQMKKKYGANMKLEEECLNNIIELKQPN